MFKQDMRFHGGEYEDGCLSGRRAINLMMKMAKTCETSVNF
jgi:hypothetical protein